MKNKIKNLKISFKLYILVGVALIGMLIIGGISFFLMGRLNDMTNDISNSWLPSINTARDMETTISNIRLNELRVLTALTDETADKSLQYIEQEKSNMNDLLTKYESLIDEEERPTYENVMNAWKQYDTADSNLISLAKQGNVDEARAILDGECVELYNSLNEACADIIAYNEHGSDEATAESLKLYHNALIFLSAIIIVIIVIGVFFSFIIIRGIKFPIFEIENAASKMAQGDLEIEISYTSKDELGVLANQVRELIRKLKTIIDDENKFLARMASGDFTVDTTCEEEYIGGFHPLLISFRKIADKLNQTILQISESSAQVASGSDQVSNEIGRAHV